MLQTVDVGRLSLEAYRVAPEAALEELTRRAEALRGARVLHINATPCDGGVSELLRAAVPLLRGRPLLRRDEGAPQRTAGR